MAHALSVLCGQLLVVGLSGTTLGTDERRALAAGTRGGVVFFRRNIAGANTSSARDGLTQLRALADDVQDAATKLEVGLDMGPAIVAIDQEGGRVMRLGSPVMQLPPMRTLGDLDDASLVTRVAAAQGRELAALGITLSFAPVADVHTHPENPIIGDRAFSTSPTKVAELAGAFADGLHQAGVLTCAKHFPGHGDTTQDSHLTLPRVEKTERELNDAELVPFAALAKRPSIDSMMTAHVVYPALDPTPHVPATLSHAICTDLLRRKLGFEGVIFSDDLEMKAITQAPREAAVLAVSAGCDALLVCSRADLADEIHEALVREAEASPAFRARCEEAFQRVRSMRRRTRRLPMPDLDALFSSTKTVSDELARRLGESRIP